MHYEWTEHHQQKKFLSPPNLKFYTTVYYKPLNSIILFGGCIPTRRVFFNDLFIFDCNTSQWTNLKINGRDTPDERFNHSAIIYSNHMVIFGGTNELYHSLPDCWSLNLDKLKWTKKNFKNEKGVDLIGRSNHTSVLYNDKMIVFGGVTSGLSNDLHVFNLFSNKWENLELCGDKPSPIYDHASVIYKDSMFVLFGEQKVKGHKVFSEDFYQLDLNTYIWKKIDLGINPPSARWCHKLQVFQDKLIMLGGETEKGEDPSTYQYSLQNSSWKVLNNETPIHSSTSLKGNEIYIFGGGNVDTNIKNYSMRIDGVLTIFPSNKKSFLLPFRDVLFV